MTLDKKKVLRHIMGNGVRCWTPIDDFCIRVLVFPGIATLRYLGASENAVGIEAVINREATRIFRASEF